MHKSSFGVIGLGVMGKNLAWNILNKGHTLSVYNRMADGEERLVEDFLSNSSRYANLQGFTDLSSFVASLEAPRKILLMIKAGSVVDQVCESIAPLLSADDVLIDGGNSHYEDTKRRVETLGKQQIHFVGCGISGGEEGARNGPSMMPGGSRASYDRIAPVLESIAAKDKNGDSCCAYIGPDGSGHFVKMIHNGIEYAEMQLLAEAYHLLRLNYTNEEIAQVFEEWNRGDLSSYLLEITVHILRKKEGEQDLLDLVLDKAANKGTGSWSSQATLGLGMPTTMMTDAVFARYISSFKAERSKLSQMIQRKVEGSFDPQQIQDTYRFARILNHQQGFALIARASTEYHWQLDLSSIARIWTNGCIIRSAFMERMIDVLKQANTLFDNDTVVKELAQLEGSASEVLQQGILSGCALPSFSSAYQYWLGMTTERLPANLLQAQRDYFGAHTYQRIDQPETAFFHSNWNS